MVCSEGPGRRKGLMAALGWFTKGFDTPDLQTAKALLQAT